MVLFYKLLLLVILRVQYSANTDTMNQIDLSEKLALIQFSGEDAASFLQGQVSNDVDRLDGIWHYSAYCNPKGRTLALLPMWRIANSFYALISDDIVDTTVNRLRMFVLRSKVQIDVLNDATIIGDLNSDLTRKAQQVSDLPTAEQGIEVSEDHVTLAFFGRCIRVFPAGASDQIRTAKNVEFETWLNANIEIGLPAINSFNTEQFIPQMINLDLLRGISFKKGCYTGQEIIARMHYLGKLKQRMLLCKIEQPLGDNMPTPISGDKILHDIEDDKVAGTIVSAGTAGMLLAVLRLENLEQPLYLASGQKLSIAEKQPYPIPDTKFA